MQINSLDYFRSHWTVWHILGMDSSPRIWEPFLILYLIVLHVVLNLGFNMHLGVSIFRNANLTDDIKNLTTFAVCFAGTLKFSWYAVHFEKVWRMEKLLKLLDLRISGDAEKTIYRQLKWQLRVILYGFIGIYLIVGILAELSFIFQEGRGLMYPARFPFDWHNSTRNYYMANAFQIFGISFQLLQNYVNDCYPPMMLCLITAHIKMLYLRFEQIGVRSTADADTDAHRELEDCITDHKRVLELFRTLESFMSLPMLIQFGVNGLNVCISLAGLLFFVTEPMSRTYFFFYAMGVPFQIFPTCYYGTDAELWFEKLHHAAFSCNWITQNRSFKRKLMLFVECSLKRNTAMAGGMLRVHVDTFFSTMKFAYSSFTILMQMRN